MAPVSTQTSNKRSQRTRPERASNGKLPGRAAEAQRWIARLVVRRNFVTLSYTW